MPRLHVTVYFEKFKYLRNMHIRKETHALVILELYISFYEIAQVSILHCKLHLQAISDVKGSGGGYLGCFVCQIYKLYYASNKLLMQPYNATVFRKISV